jgi:tetratricopeptide (TPR) repeat protein
MIFERSIILIVSLLIPGSLIAQSSDIQKILIAIESGEAESAQKQIEELRSTIPESPNIDYLEALITEDGNKALQMYEQIYRNAGGSQFAADALYNIYSYYYSVGLYESADRYLDELNRKYPDYNPSLRSKFSELESDPSSKRLERYSYTVQVGAFTNIKNAINLKNKFAEEGFYTDTFTKSIGGTLFNIVIVGRFISQSEAEDMKRSIETEYKIQGRVVPFEK